MNISSDWHRSLGKSIWQHLGIQAENTKHTGDQSALESQVQKNNSKMIESI